MIQIKVINIKGSIVDNNDQWIYDWLDMEATSPRAVHEQLTDANGIDLEVHINSGGGSVFAGSEIYTALKDYKGNVTVKIVGIAASAASVIAMAGNKVMMSPTSQMMIHNVSTVGRGDYRDMNHTSEVLKKSNQTLANAYSLKSGLSADVFLGLMDAETWFIPSQALAYKLIDGVLFESTELEQAKAKLKLLKLKVKG